MERPEEEPEDTMPAPEPPSGVRQTPETGKGFIGRYQLCFELASGGMAKVYLARVEGIAGFEKLVAIKRIHPHLAEQEEFVEMFLDEARIASRINHPNVCTVFDFGRSGEDYYIAMEFLRGEPMARLMRTAVYTPGMIRSRRWTALMLRVIAEACEGLHAAHDQRNEKGESLNVVHRDVSPHNLFLGYDGGVKIVDFGIASAKDRLHTTQVGTVKGRHAYMAPEQAQGMPLDRRADVWSLGVILWETLSGKRLFKRATDAETLMALVRDPIPRLSEVWTSVPSEIDAVVMKALERDRDQRWASARDFGREIDRLLMRLEYPAGKAELAELMEELFHEQREQRARMIEEARTMAAGVVRRVLDDESSSALGVVVYSDDQTRQRKKGRVVSALALGAGVVGGVALTLLLTKMLDQSDADAASASSAAPSAIVAPATEEAGAGGGEGGERFGEAGNETGEGASAEPGSGGERVEAAAGEGAPEAPAEGDRGTGGSEMRERIASSGRQGSAARRQRERERTERVRTERAARDRSRTVAAREPGVVSVVTPGGWADVYFRGTKIGRTPGRFELPSGNQTIFIRPFGQGAPQRETVEVPSGGQARVSVRVTPN